MRGYRLVVPALLASGCQPAQRSSLALLKNGDASLCVQNDVRSALGERLRQGLPGYTIRYADTTVIGFDAAILRMTCVTRAIGYSDARPGQGSEVRYTVSPNLDSGGLIVAVDAAGLRDFANALDPQPSPTPTPSATIGEAALIGRYIASDRPRSECDGDAVVSFGADHGYAADGIEGSWTLAGETVTVTARYTDDTDRPGEAAGFVWTALGRSGDGLSYRDASGAAGLLQRCADAPPP